MPGRMQTSNIVQTLKHESDSGKQPRSLGATVSIWPYAPRGPHVAPKTLAQIVRQPGVESPLVGVALEDVDVVHKRLAES
jgi:hypothetical protein